MRRRVKSLKESVMLAAGAGVGVAVLDSGIDPSFPLLADGRGQNFVVEDGPDGLLVTEVDRLARTDDSGHGSCVHSCARIAAPEAVIDHYRILDSDNQCSSKLLCLALDHVISKKYQVVNLSLGTRNEAAVPWLVSIVKRAYESDTCLVSASSNLGNSLFPGRFTYSISVGARQGESPMSVSFQPHRVVEFAGWGVDVPVPAPAGRTLRVSGTSYASGFVAGLCARVIETMGTSSPLDVKLTLRDMALSLDEDTRAQLV